MDICSCWFCERSLNIIRIQTYWHATLVATTYSASTKGRVKMGCFFESHDTTPIPKWNVCLDIIFLSSSPHPLSVRVYPMSLKFYEVEYIMPIYFVPLTYLIIILPAFQWDSFGESMNLEIRLTPYMMSGIVIVKYIKC